MQQPLPPCLIQQPGSDLEKQSQFSATSTKRNVPGEQGCANKRGESTRRIRGARWPSEGPGTAGMVPAGSPLSRQRLLLRECLNSRRGTGTFLGATACPTPSPQTGKPAAFSPFHATVNVPVPSRPQAAPTEIGSISVAPTAHGLWAVPRAEGQQLTWLWAGLFACRQKLIRANWLFGKSSLQELCKESL